MAWVMVYGPGPLISFSCLTILKFGMGAWKCIMCANIYIGIKAWVFQLDPFSFFFFLFFFFLFYLLMLYYLFPYICMGWINQACVIILYFLIFILKECYVVYEAYIYIYIYILIKSCYVNMIIVGWWRKFFFDTKLLVFFFAWFAVFHHPRS